MTKFILVIILNSIPQSIQVFDNRQECFNTSVLLKQVRKIESYCVPQGISPIAEVSKKEMIG